MSEEKYNVCFLKEFPEIMDRWDGRQALIEQQAARVEGSKKIQDVL